MTSRAAPPVPPQGAKNFAYVPATQPPSKEIIGGIDRCNVITGSRCPRPAATSSLQVAPPTIPPAVTDPPDQLLR
ncbi:hypothetical protein PCASD_21680 [Puccinia coronata f. sp. avenae]|uniref:Uncharacterized protein n=1 Tax=Puccinia coronata f. sp. avenae TaxID=200324 RepID=A0A2N5U365_9BASI|nr:hypothetical protein PCASD_21680 [Puccinia coronata f. sp. avenae]